LLAVSAQVSDTMPMGDHRPRPEGDRILVAKLTGEARHHARWRPLTAEEEAAALAELRALAGGRADLLAEVAGIFEGTSEGELDEPLARCAALLCRRAGADTAAIPAWIEEGRRRAANARRPPSPGGPGLLPILAGRVSTSGKLIRPARREDNDASAPVARSASGKVLEHQLRTTYGRGAQNGGSSV
jgi:hypothetical protein